ncbi:hypothetical protein D3C81_1107170 [compost metagenome]
MTEPQAPQQHQANHQAGPSNRHFKTGQQPVTQRRGECEPARPGQPRQAVRPQPIAGQPGDQQVDDSRQ